MRHAWLACMVAMCAAAPLAAQATGAVAGRVRDATAGTSLEGALVVVDGRQGAVTDSGGRYRIREVRAGVHVVRVTRIGYRPVEQPAVIVIAGGTVVVDFALSPVAVPVSPVEVTAGVDPVLDPLATATAQRIDAADLRALPVTTVQEAVALSAGAVGESYRGGRLGQDALILDGLGVKNQLDASSGPVGFRIPPDLLTEASLVTNGFSARYGQALSGMINVVTKDAGSGWRARTAWETDRPLGDGWDYGLDRLVLTADGPLPGGVGFVGAVDVEGRVDAEPLDAPAPTEPRDPRAALPYLLPHNTGERMDVATKLIVPLGSRYTLRLFGLRAMDQRLLFDPAYKYDLSLAPARRVSANLGSMHLQRLSGPEAERSFTADVRVGYYDRDVVRGTLRDPPAYRVGALTLDRFRFVGEDLARARDTAAARAAVAGFDIPEFSTATPWGVPAFFMGGASRGEISWNAYRELRGQLDLTLGLGSDLDLYVGGGVSGQRVETFERVLGYLPTGDSVPPPAASAFEPRAAALYAESQWRIEDLAITFGARYDGFDHRSDLSARASGFRHSINPRLAVSTVLSGATVVASWGRFSQAPDYQYLVDAAFDDTLRTGRFRRGNPNLGFEQATQYELSVRARLSPGTALRVNAYVKQLDGLVASVPLGVEPDSTIFGNADFGTVRGVELLLEREWRGRWGARVAYTFQTATATATDAFQLFRRIRIEPGGDTLFPARVQYPLDYDRRHGLVVVLRGLVPRDAGPRLAGLSPVGGLEAALVGRYSSGLPYSRTNATGDTLLGLPNAQRLPSQYTVDALLRRSIRIAGRRGGIYVDVRNVLNRRNVVALRRDTGEPGLGEAGLAAEARAAYLAHPQAIPYESSRYRAWADTDRNGLVEGEAELYPLFLAAARDYYQPLFAYGPPRLVRIGMELEL